MMRRSDQAGFSLIEMIVSLALFAVVVTVSVGALLILIASNSQLQNDQAVLSNLAFAIDSMSREIRTGTYYYCAGNTDSPNIFGTSYNLNTIDAGGLASRDCNFGRVSSANRQGVAIIEGGNSLTGSGGQRILYYFDSRPAAKGLYRKIGAGQPELLVSTGLDIRDVEFFVTGSTPLSGASTDQVQPVVTIVIQAAESDDASAVVHTVQTSVTQRSIDI